MPIEVDGHPIKYELLPERFRGGVERWIEHGIEPGNFLSSVIDDDLLDALGSAGGDMTRADIRDIALWFHWEAPTVCHGSLAKSRTWGKERRKARSEAA